MFRSLLPALATLAVAAPAAAADTTIAPLERETPVREHGGVLLYSDWDAAAGAYFLVASFEGRAERLPVPPSPQPFDADIGSDTAGDPAVVVALIGQAETARSGGRDLFVHTLGSDELRPVTNANTALDEHTPSIWRGRIAFARAYGDTPVVYTKPLVAPRSRPSTRQPGVPERRCELRVDDRASCVTVEREVSELELYGRRLGQVVTFQVESGAGARENEVRLVDVARRTARPVDRSGTGEEDQHFLGVSFAGGRMSWHRSCGGQVATCAGGYGTYRYDYAAGRYAFAEDTRRLGGYAYGNGSVWRVELDRAGECDGQPCRFAPARLVRSDVPQWEPVAADRVR